ncbi:hypothetical protein [Flagellimonas marinaquae]|uniref:hypothetical protein n=1 Tax=Flagellimonas marinaquae TaxID=254955 RepID=UPI0020762363|nr:hypothetical protein [Allomuricauda aquimarina]USD24598.1 hypothetical protein MJO53_13040 [Allomuricauda aquimarina]
METKTKETGTKKTVTRQKASNKDVKDQLTKEATGSANGTEKTKEAKAPVVVPKISIDSQIQKFEKLRGLATNRERLNQTLGELTKFNYNQDGSSSFYIRDSHGLEFKTTNSNLINLVTTQLQNTLEERKSEFEQEILAFEL